MSNKATRPTERETVAAAFGNTRFELRCIRVTHDKCGGATLYLDTATVEAMAKHAHVNVGAIRAGKPVGVKCGCGARLTIMAPLVTEAATGDVESAIAVELARGRGGH